MKIRTNERSSRSGCFWRACRRAFPAKRSNSGSKLTQDLPVRCSCSKSRRPRVSAVGFFLPVQRLAWLDNPKLMSGRKSCKAPAQKASSFGLKLLSFYIGSLRTSSFNVAPFSAATAQFSFFAESYLHLCKLPLQCYSQALCLPLTRCQLEPSPSSQIRGARCGAGRGRCVNSSRRGIKLLPTAEPYHASLRWHQRRETEEGKERFCFGSAPQWERSQASQGL